MCPLIYKYISIDRYRYIDNRGCGEHFRCVETSLKTDIFSRITMCPFGLEKVDTWAQNLVTHTPPRSYALSESGHKLYTKWTQTGHSGRDAVLRHAIAIDVLPHIALNRTHPRQGVQLEPHLLVGWGILAHGETMGAPKVRFERQQSCVVKTHFFSRITMCPFGLEKVDTWAQNLVTHTPPRSYALSESGHKVYTNWTHHSEKSNPLGAHQHPKFSDEGKNEPIAPLVAASRAREPPQSYNGWRAPPILNQS